MLSIQKTSKNKQKTLSKQWKYSPGWNQDYKSYIQLIQQIVYWISSYQPGSLSKQPIWLRYWFAVENVDRSI